jgi:hypothetical protein
MAMSENDHGDTVLTIGLLGGGAFLLWLLWSGRGNGSGGGKDNGSGGAGDRSSTPVPGTPAVVRIRSGDRVDLDGVTADLATIVARARTVGAVDVIPAGDAREGWVNTVINALADAGIHVVKVTHIIVNPRNRRASRLSVGGVPVKAHKRRWPRHGA